MLKQVVRGSRGLYFLLLLLSLAGCATKPHILTTEEIAERVEQDWAAMFADKPDSGAMIPLPEAVARSIKYNLDNRLKGRDATTVTNDGSNIILVTYDATLQSSANALETLTSTAEILAFAGLEGGADYTAGSSDPQWRDSADTTLSGTTITKEIANSGIVDADNGPRDAVVGEFVQYELVIQVPEGEMPLAEILDNLDSGLVFVSLDSVTPSSGAVTTGTVTPPSAGSTGTLAFDLGTITNANTDNSTAETLTLRYTVRVANDANALNGAELNSDVKLRWDVDGNGANTNTNDGSVNDSDGSIPNHRVTVLEPELDVTQLITTAPADEGDAIVYQITINHDSLSSASAYDVTFSDVVPAGISVSSITATHSAAGDIGPTGSNILQLSSNTVTTGAGLSFDLLEAESVVITITGTLTNAIAGADVINSATINWSSLDAATVDGDDANERDGSSGYVGTSLAASFTADSVALIKEVVSTGIVTADNANLEASIGEYVNYRIVVTLPEGDAPLAQIVDTFPTEILAIVDADGGMIDQGAGTITWNIDTLAVGEQLQFDVVVQVLSTAVIDNSDQLFSSAVSVTGDNDNGADLNPANNNAVASTQLLSDVGDVNFLLDGSRDPRAALHFSGEYPRDFEYNAYPHWLHGRLVGLETMQVEANLVAARTEVELDSAFGLWNHSFYPNPWNHLRAGNTETQELNADYSHWAEPRLNQAIVNGNAVDRINLDGTMVDFADLEQAPNLPQQEAQLQLFKRAVQHEKAMPPGDSSGTRQFEQAANTLRAASIEELVAAFREGRK